MAAQQSSKRKKPVVNPDEETRGALEKARAEVGVAQARAKNAERARLRAEAALAEAQQALAAAQAEFEQARTVVERALAQVRQTIETEAENREPPPTALGEEDIERRVTFIVRLTVDERNQPRRTEVEHAQSGKKKIFLGLDERQLATFMKVYLSLPNPAGTNDFPRT